MSASTSNSLRSASFRREVWRLIAPYWRSEDKFAAWSLLLVIIALTLGAVYIDVLFNDWYNRFYNSLQHKQKDDFFREMGWFCVLAAIWVVVVVYTTYLNQMLQIRWRNWLTKRYLTEWVGDRTYYHLQLTDTQGDNPDQRIAEDLRLFVEECLELSLGFLNASVTFVSFVTILWALSGPISFALAGTNITIPGYMVWAAVLYAGVGTWIIRRVGHPLVDLNNNQQRLEADFRFGLARFRENTEGVALYRGESDELKGFKQRFSALYANWMARMKRQKRFGWWQSGYNQLSVPFPYLVAAPRFFSGAIELGGLMQIGNAFGQVKGSLSWFINVYGMYANWRATTDRLLSFHRAIELTRAARQSGTGPLVESSTHDDMVRIDGLRLALPRGDTVLETTQFHIKQGDSVLIKGPTGCGKSTLFRAIAGIWPFGEGTVQVTNPFDVLFLPQRPYFPLGNLRLALSYPSSVGSHEDDLLRATLVDVGLGHLVGALDDERIWSMQLSGGEQQRIAVARALLRKPQWLFLDEATSNLDDDAQHEMYTLLRARLPGTTLVSIGHRADLARFHDKVVELHKEEIGVARLMLAAT